MTGADWLATLMGAGGLLSSAFVGYLVYRASERASQRGQAVQSQQNATEGFDLLTTQQREELTRAYKRAEHAEVAAEASRVSAAQSRDAAEEAQGIAEKCQTQQVTLIAYVRDLYEWAEQPCPHPQPPPQPPLRAMTL